MTSSPLVGTWRLLSCETKRADGTIDYPFGAQAAGFIIYTDDGYMSVVITSSGRDLFEANDPVGGSAAEKAQAAETTCPTAAGTSIAAIPWCITLS
jgi:hypothetical protein